MSYLLAAVAFALFGLFWWYWRRSRRSIAYLPGPPSGSWLVGNLITLERRDDAADAHFEWTKKYGNAFRLKNCFGEDVLYLSDPKAMQYILNTSGYSFHKTPQSRIFISLATGPGLLAVDGEQHARHRRVMNPSFSTPALKAYLPLFFKLSQKTTSAWTAMIRKNNSEASILDVSSLLSRTTLDIIGEVAFDYKRRVCMPSFDKFNSIENIEPKTELHKAYQNLFVDTNFMLSDFNVMFRRLLGYSPHWVVEILTSLPKQDMRRLNNYMSLASNVGKRLVETEMQAIATGKEGAKNVMSIFVRANNAEDPKRRLEEDEISPQITTLLLAGHETTASSLGWTLWELSKRPDCQRKLREEVRATKADVASRGESDMNISDLESMQYARAVMKETLRYHPIVTQLSRQAGRDDTIPLCMPQKTVSGNIIMDVSVRKGQIVQLGFAAYNRVWGEDADEWRPERYLEEPPIEQKTKLGVFGNLATFSSGLRSCVGWRFALIEMQAILIELIDKFDFSPAPNVEIRRAACGLMQSMVKGQEHKGRQLPLHVSIAPTHNVD